MGLTGTVLEDLTGAFTRDASYVNTAVWQSLHSANPGSTGSNEITSGTGALGRQQVVFNPGSSGTDTNSSDVAIQMPANTTATWIGFWTAQTGGTFLGGFPMIGTQKTAVGISGANTVYCPAHGLVVGQAVRCYSIAGLQSSLPSPLVADLQYLVNTAPSLDTITLTHGGGGPISLTSSGGFGLALDFSQTTGPMGGSVVFPASLGITYATVS